MKTKKIKLEWKVSNARYAELLRAAKSWGHKTLKSYLKEIIKVKAGRMEG